MTHQHKRLVKKRWAKLSLVEQMANVGSEVERAISWKNKGNKEYSQASFYRALELLSLTIDNSAKPKLYELTRVYEVLVDYFYGDNVYGSSDNLWKKYFLALNYAARR